MEGKTVRRKELEAFIKLFFTIFIDKNFHYNKINHCFVDSCEYEIKVDTTSDKIILTISVDSFDSLEFLQEFLYQAYNELKGFTFGAIAYNNFNLHNTDSQNIYAIDISHTYTIID